jgi:hypothetical protein
MFIIGSVSSSPDKRETGRQPTGLFFLALFAHPLRSLRETPLASFCKSCPIGRSKPCNLRISTHPRIAVEVLNHKSGPFFRTSTAPAVPTGRARTPWKIMKWRRASPAALRAIICEPETRMNR